MADAQLTDEELRTLLALRTTLVRGVPAPSVPMTTARRLGGLWLIRSKLTGGVEITVVGIAVLEQRLLFCRAKACDGILRRWALTDQEGPVAQLRDDPAEHGGRRFSLICLKCGATNVLKATSMPRDRSVYVVTSVL